MIHTTKAPFWGLGEIEAWLRNEEDEKVTEVQKAVFRP
jgi:hypothetical protein